jgi:hypothetical protein
MERPKLTPERAELIINFLRNNPGVDMTLGDIGDQTALPVEDLGVYLTDLVSRRMLEHETTVDGFDIYRFPADFQRGTMAPSN